MSNSTFFAVVTVTADGKNFHGVKPYGVYYVVPVTVKSLEYKVDTEESAFAKATRKVQFTKNHSMIPELFDTAKGAESFLMNDILSGEYKNVNDFYCSPEYLDTVNDDLKSGAFNPLSLVLDFAN